MILTKCGTLPDKMFENYLDRLVGRFFKILAMKEDNNNTLNAYIHSFQSELVGSKNLISLLNDDARFMILVNVLQFFLDNEYSNKECKREVMKCIDISKQLKSFYFPKDGDSDG